MHYDVAIIGAGMSGLAAGIRLAHFGKSVCIFERHYAYGGLNSYYRLGSREFDVGLHALTNYVPKGTPNVPLTKMLRQLRIPYESLELRQQKRSSIVFPGRRLEFTNDIDVLKRSVADVFPHQARAFDALVEKIRGIDDISLNAAPDSARRVLVEHFDDPLLIEMILCVPMLYGCASEHDMNWTEFVTMFKSIFLEGFARPREGVRTIIKALVKRYRQCGGKLRMQTGVSRIDVEGDRAASLTLDDGEAVMADVVFSCAGHVETLRLCQPSPAAPAAVRPGRMSFIESISFLDVPPASLGLSDTICFFNNHDEFCYAQPESAVDTRSGVICCPNNYEGHDDMSEGVVRVTSIANYARWAAMNADEYAQAKQRAFEQQLDVVEQFAPAIRDHVRDHDLFTPRTIERFTGHVGGAVYGTPDKVRTGETPLDNLFLCGSDQGFLGIVGATLSGITMANLHVLAKE